MTKLTTAEIDARVAGLDATFADLRLEAEGLSLDALSGDSVAADRLATINVEVARLEGERRTLNQARAGAARIEDEAAAVERKARQKAHLADARVTAEEIKKRAQRVDEIAMEFRDILAELRDLELGMRKSLQGAGLPLNGRVGQEGIATIALRHISSLDQPAAMRPQRSMVDTMDAAWGPLLDGDDEPGEDI